MLQFWPLKPSSKVKRLNAESIACAGGQFHLSELTNKAHRTVINVDSFSATHENQRYDLAEWGSSRIKLYSKMFTLKFMFKKIKIRQMYPLSQCFTLYSCEAIGALTLHLKTFCIAILIRGLALDLPFCFLCYLKPRLSFCLHEKSDGIRDGVSGVKVTKTITVISTVCVFLMYDQNVRLYSTKAYKNLIC